VKRNEYSISRKDYSASVLTSIFGAVVAPAMFFFGLKLTSAIDSSLLSNGEVIFSILLVLTIFGVDYEFCYHHYQSLATIVAIQFIGLTLDIVMRALISLYPVHCILYIIWL
jgi:hypothetical protein